jgi:hypothetical protein
MFVYQFFKPVAQLANDTYLPTFFEEKNVVTLLPPAMTDLVPKKTHVSMLLTRSCGSNTVFRLLVIVPVRTNWCLLLCLLSIRTRDLMSR